LVPNLITTASLLLGFWSIVQASKGLYGQAALGIVIAVLCDALDGRIARATRSTSRFGLELDSIADAVSFGVAPAFLVYSWTLAPLGRGWLVAALFAVCAALRLARFNVQAQRAESTRYQGLPSTVAGGFVAVSVWFVEWLGFTPPLPKAVGFWVTGAFAAVALLMVSSLPYPSVKGVRLTSRHRFPVLVAAAVGLVLVLLHHEPVLFGLGLMYLLAGPGLWALERRSSARGAQEPLPALQESTSDDR
jgi:CDP-diacylglycerol--serine O-phosphatidyltransferase